MSGGEQETRRASQKNSLTKIKQQHRVPRGSQDRDAIDGPFAIPQQTDDPFLQSQTPGQGSMGLACNLALWLLLQVWVPILWFSTPSPTYQSSALSESCFLVSTVDPVLSGTYPMGSPLVCVSLQAGIGLKEALPALLKLPPGPSVC